MADAADLKSADGFLLYGFESRLRQFRAVSEGFWCIGYSLGD